MQFCYLAVIPAEDGQQVAGEVVLIRVRKAADDGTIDSNVGGILRVTGVDKDISRVHVCVEETVAKNLREKNLHAALPKQFEVGALRPQGIEVSNRYAGDALHGKDIPAGVIPVNLRYVDQFVAFEIAP